MKKTLLIIGVVGLAAVAWLAFNGGPRSWAMGPGMMGGWGPGWSQSDGNGSRGWGRGPGWGRRNGWGGGGGCGQVCGGGWGAGDGSGYNRPKGFTNQGPVNQDQAKDIASDFIARGNPSLKVGRIKDAGNYFEVEILGSDGKFYDRLGVEKNTGLIRPIS